MDSCVFCWAYWDVLGVCLFFKQKTAYEVRISDWSSDVCSSDLIPKPLPPRREARLEPSRASGSSRFGGAAATASPVSGDHQAWRLAAKTGEAPSGGEAGISPPGTALPEVLG